MAREVVNRNSLAKVDCSIVECFPVERQFEVILQVDADVGPGSYGPKGGTKLSVVDPDLYIWSMKELIETASMVDVQMADDDLLHILDFMTRLRDRRFQPMLGFVADSREDVGVDGAAMSRVFVSGSGLPEDEALVWMVDQDTIHG